MAVVKRLLLYIFLASSFSLLPSNFAFATVIHVPANQPTIQAGINAAVNGDTVLVADGTYIGSGNREIVYNGKSILVKSERGADSCIIDCQGLGGGFVFRSNETSDAILYGFTIMNGNTTYGGAIQSNLGSSPTIKNCIFRSNTATYGGAFSPTTAAITELLIVNSMEIQQILAVQSTFRV